MQQGRFQVHGRPCHHLDDVKYPQHLGKEELALHPRHLATDTSAGAQAEERDALACVVGKDRVVQWVVRWQPALRLVVTRIVKVFRRAGERENTALHGGLWQNVGNDISIPNFWEKEKERGIFQ